MYEKNNSQPTLVVKSIKLKKKKDKNIEVNSVPK